MIESNFILANQSEVQFAAIFSKKITLKEVKKYLHILSEAKQQISKLKSDEKLPSAFDFCSDGDADMEDA